MENTKNRIVLENKVSRQNEHFIYSFVEQKMARFVTEPGLMMQRNACQCAG
jgi:hypothetical protein